MTSNKERTLRKLGLAGIYLQMALILWQVNGEECAMEFAQMFGPKEVQS